MKTPITIDRNRDGSYSATAWIVDNYGIGLTSCQFYGYTKREIPKLMREYLNRNGYQRAKI